MDEYVAEKSKVKVVGGVLLTLLRLLFGAMLIMSGVTGLLRPDAAAWLAEAINSSLEAGRPFGFYGAFLRGVVVGNFGLFARWPNAKIW